MASPSLIKQQQHPLQPPVYSRLYKVTIKSIERQTKPSPLCSSKRFSILHVSCFLLNNLKFAPRALIYHKQILWRRGWKGCRVSNPYTRFLLLLLPLPLSPTPPLYANSAEKTKFVTKII